MCHQRGPWVRPCLGEQPEIGPRARSPLPKQLIRGLPASASIHFGLTFPRQEIMRSLFWSGPRVKHAMDLGTDGHLDTKALSQTVDCAAGQNPLHLRPMSWRA
mgnify:CR=1 FL=1